MGVISWPRLYFAGYNYWNPSTMNNNDYAPSIEPYDVEQADLDWTYLRTQGVEGGAEFQRWAITPTRGQSDGETTYHAIPPAEWGFHGGNECGFVTAIAPFASDPVFYKPPLLTSVIGYTNRNGAYVDAGDPWLGQPLQFNQDFGSDAKLVDVNSQAFWSSQIFADTFTLGDATQGFSATVASRMHSRWQYLTRNYNVNSELMIAGPVSALFQTCFDKQSICFAGDGSELADELITAMDAPDVAGLMLRFTVYDTLYFQGSVFSGPPGDRYVRMQQMAALYQQYSEALAAYKAGRSTTAPVPPLNRAYSRVSGWIGLWKHGEWTNAPGGRLLLPLVQPGQSLPTAIQPQAVQAKGLPDSYYTPQGGNPPKALVSLGPAVAEVETDGDEVIRLAVDLGTTIPEYDSSARRAEFGMVQLGLALLHPDGSLRELLPLADLADDSDGTTYQASYDRTSGVVDVAREALLSRVTASLLANNPLVLTVESYTPDSSAPGGFSATRTIGLAESPLNAQTDQRGVYVNQPNAPWMDQSVSSFTVQVRRYGQIPPSGTQLVVAQYNEGLTTPWTLVGAGTSIEPFVQLLYRNPSGEFTPITSTTALDASLGEVTIGAVGLQPGVPNIVFYPLEAGVSGFTPPAIVIPPNIMATAYTVVRVLPFHNQLAQDFARWLQTGPDIDLVNQRVFDTVYRTFFLMYPVMDFIHSPLKFQEWRGVIRQVTDPAVFESARYMPVMRSLSAGQRYILNCYWDYLDRAPEGEAARRDPPTRLRVRKG
ncbi:MAG: hypothetical protein OHK0022_13410 [Roseiflexaceae bacterium]